MRDFLALSLYRLTFLILLPIILLLFVCRSLNHSAYRTRLLERLGFVSTAFKKHGIIIHAASVGEVIALKPFIDKLLVQYTDTPVTITTFTPTGSAQVQKSFQDKVQHCYFPLDIFPCTWLFLKALKPKVIVLMETELWPNIIAQAHNNNIKLQLINGRLSDKSMKSYRKLDWLIRPCLQRIDNILSQSEDNLNNFIALGANQERSQISGNIKFDLSLNPNVQEKAASLQTYISGKRKVWLVASTHPGDEAIVLSSYKKLRINNPDLLLMLVPRHPERFDSIFQQCQEHRFNVVRRSEKTKVTNESDIWLIDTLGELLAACSLADVVTMGGSFSTIGGHNPLEPALFKKAIVVGHDMANFRKVMEQLTLNNGIKQLPTAINSSTEEVENALYQAIEQLFSNENELYALGENAYKVVQENQGASTYSLERLNLLIKKP